MIVQASDGVDALHKLNNDPPQVLVIEQGLAKRSGSDVVRGICRNTKFSKTAIIFLSAIPDRELLVDEVVTGQVQFVQKVNDEGVLSRAFTKALNFNSIGEKSDFLVRYLHHGDFLMRKGEKADFVYIVKSGQLRAQVAMADRTIVLGLIESGEFVGEMAYINGEPRICDVLAMQECELIQIPVDHLDHLLFQKPSWARALLKTLSKRVKLAAEKEANRRAA